MSSAKAKILEAASELFLEGGSAALSVRAISKKAGVSTIGIYSYFQGKQGILDELYIEGFELILASMNIKNPNIDSVQYILQCINGYLLVSEKYEAHYRLIFGESNTGYVPSKEAKEVAEKAFNRLVEVTETLLPKHVSLKIKQKTAIETWAFLHGFVSLKHHTISSLMPAEEWKKMTLDAVTDHIKTLQSKNA